ncbi:MAG TPA: AIR synthase-related protein [Candidatus Limnocylindria bacterium]|nr:AIR synthase-related protein [Candidatus Limnocylindria bacterium]
MSALGKLSPAAFERLIAPHLGAARPEVLVGPKPGMDSAIVRIGAGRVLAITTDPLSIVPALGLEDSARLACHLLASDLWTSGIPPAYASVCLNLPPALPDAELERYVKALGAEWQRLGVAVIAGHTGRYPGGDSSIVGAATLIGVGDEGRHVTSAMAAPGDRVIVTKGCAIEATAIAARMFPGRLAQWLDEAGLERARALLARVSVVDDCRILLALGVRDRGVTGLHDATESGVLGGLLELARASGHDVRVERAKVPLAPEAEAACQAFGGIDPYWTLSEGTLIATVRPERSAEALAALAEAGIVAAEVGDVMRGAGVLWLTEPDGRVTPIREPEPDPYWDAYARALREGWS